MTKSRYYFAYGSNLNPERMNSRVNKVLSAQPATLCGYRLVFNKQASQPGETYANLEWDPLAQTEGVLYEITPDELNHLDEFEGVANHHYYRKTLPVYLRARRPTQVEAEVYLACEQRICEGFPQRGYLNHLLKGEHFLNKSYLQFLKQVTCMNEPVKVAVYGTLRRNQGNHFFLEEAQYLGTAETLYPYALYLQGLPYVTEQKSVVPIRTEIYLISQEQLKQLDQLEGHPTFYQRKLIPLIDQAQNLVFAWLYFSKSPTGQLKRNGDFLKPDLNPGLSADPLGIGNPLPQTFTWVENGDIEAMQSQVSAMENLLNALVEDLIPNSEYSEATLRHFLNSLLNGQRNEMNLLKKGSWAVIPDEDRPPPDIRVDFVFKPTYLAVALLNLCRRRWPNWFSEESEYLNRIKKGLWFCTLRKLKGAGYSTREGQIEAIRILAKGQVGQSLSESPELCPELRMLLGKYPSLGD